MSQGETFSLPKVFQIAVDSKLADLNICLPGQVVSYDRATQTAQIQPSIKIKYADGTIVDRPIINRVPIGFHGTKDVMIHFDLKPEDTGILVFSQRSLDIWKEKGGLVSPDDPRKFNLTDAFFIPGGRPAAMPYELKGEENSLVMINKDGLIEVTPAGKFKITNGTEELLDLIDQALDEIISTEDTLNKDTTNTIFGPMKLNSFAQYAVFKGKLETIKSKLATIKGS